MSKFNTVSVTDPTITFKLRMTEKDCIVLKDMLQGKATTRYEKRVASIVINALEKKL